jgi:hypothetical protein
MRYQEPFLPGPHDIFPETWLPASVVTGINSIGLLLICIIGLLS